MSHLGQAKEKAGEGNEVILTNRAGADLALFESRACPARQGAEVVVQFSRDRGDCDL